MGLLEKLYNKECDLKTLSPLTLAFVGDGVFDLFVREQLVEAHNRPVGVLHKLAVESVRCEAQARAALLIAPLLSEEEAEIFKRGRNAHTTHTPKNASPADYHAATGLETLFGYLYLKGEIERLRLLFGAVSEG